MIEYTHELMNSECEVIDFVRRLVDRVIGGKLIETQVLAGFFRVFVC